VKKESIMTKRSSIPTMLAYIDQHLAELHTKVAEIARARAERNSRGDATSRGRNYTSTQSSEDDELEETDRRIQHLEQLREWLLEEDPYMKDILANLLKVDTEE
jgi:hypothetical protein